MTEDDLLDFLRRQRWAAQSSVSQNGAPQSALIGIAVTESLEIVFDTLETTRKAMNLRRNPHVAFVIGGWADGDERTVQYQGVADFPEGADLDRMKAVYFAAFPDGRERERWPGLVYVRARPSWIRYSDFHVTPPYVQEFRFPADTGEKP
jgi:general stress protein 26